MTKLAPVRTPALLALFSHLCALMACWLLLFASARLLGVQVTLLVASLIQGLLAALIGQRLGLSGWWWPINLGFFPGLVLMQNYALPPWVPLIGFVVLLLLNWNALVERVPLYLTGPAAERVLAERLARLGDGFRFVDLGCGVGGSLLRLARAYPTASFVGVETAPLSFLICWLRCLPRRNCSVRMRSLWREPLGRYDAVYCFLSPAPMPRLWEKARIEMRPGALLISNSFEVPGVPAEEVLPVDDLRRSRLLIWRPGHAAAPDGPGANG
ncbi:class I SAM-dependent methyltransferase [Stutzerimonas marianensis]|uniref:class I SAM-dependent methyltransferase n=1 Tax=Stutzerimonas marianensis TaxID=2929513 RepID=UPI003C2EFD1B